MAREEGGTPGIVEPVRAGLVVALKQAVGTDLIREREERFLRRALDRWRRNPNLELLGIKPGWARVSFNYFISDAVAPGAAPQRAARRPGRPRPGAGASEDALAGYLRQARALLGAAGPFTPVAGPSWLPPELERLRDFHLPGDAAS